MSMLHMHRHILRPIVKEYISLSPSVFFLLIQGDCTIDRIPLSTFFLSDKRLL